MCFYIANGYPSYTKFKTQPSGVNHPQQFPLGKDHLTHEH